MTARPITLATATALNPRPSASTASVATSVAVRPARFREHRPPHAQLHLQDREHAERHEREERPERHDRDGDPSAMVERKHEARADGCCNSQDRDDQPQRVGRSHHPIGPLGRGRDRDLTYDDRGKAYVGESDWDQ
jgi:hypothetical protein